MTGEDWLLITEAFAALALAGGGLVVWMYSRRRLRKRARQTQSPWDDLLINVIDPPLISAIIALGLQHAALSLARYFPQFGGVRDFSSDLRVIIIVVAGFWLLMRLIAELERIYRNRVLRIGDKDLAPGTLYSVFRMLRFVVFILAALTAMDANFGFRLFGAAHYLCGILWLGVMIAVNLQTSFLLFYLRGVAPKSLPSSKIYRGAIPFVLLQLTLLLILWYLPQAATWLPEKVYG